MSGVVQKVPCNDTGSAMSFKAKDAKKLAHLNMTHYFINLVSGVAYLGSNFGEQLNIF